MVRDVLIWAAGALILAGGVWRSVQLWRHSTTRLDFWPMRVVRAFPTSVGMVIPRT
jgi:hypothetical protein